MCKLGRRAVLVREQLRRHVLEIGEVHETAPPLFGGIGRAEVERQRQQRLHGRGRRVQVGKRLRGGDVDLFLQRLDGFFRRVALRLDAVAHVRVWRLARAAEPWERHVLQRRHSSIPAPVAGVRERAQAVGRGRKAVAVDVHKPLHVLVRHDVELRLKHAAPVLHTLLHACQQRPTPRRGAGVCHAVEREQIHLLCGPLLGPGMALHLVVEREHQLAQTCVVAPAADGVGQQPKAGVGIHAGVGALERVLQRRCAQGDAALGIGDLKVRRERKGCAVGAQEVCAEAVDRADLGVGAQRGLPPQAAVFGVGGNARIDPVEDAAAQLGRGCARVGDDEEAVDVGRVLRVREVGHEALGEHAGLAAARCRGHEHGAASCVDRSALFGCKVQFSHASRLLSGCSRSCRRGALSARGGSRPLRRA